MLPYNKMHNNYHSQPLCVVKHLSRFRSVDNDAHISNMSNTSSCLGHHISQHVPNGNLVSSACYRSMSRPHHNHDQPHHDQPHHISPHVTNTNMVSSVSTRSMNNTRHHREGSGPHICPYQHRSSSSIKRCRFKQNKQATLCNGNGGDWNDFDLSSKPYYHLRT